MGFVGLMVEHDSVLRAAFGVVQQVVEMRLESADID